MPVRAALLLMLLSITPAWAMDGVDLSQLTFEAGMMEILNEDVDLEAPPPIVLADGVSVLFEKMRFQADHVHAWQQTLIPDGQPWIRRARFLPGPNGPEPDRVQIDTRFTEIEGIPFKGVLRPRTILVDQGTARPKPVPEGAPAKEYPDQIIPYRIILQDLDWFRADVIEASASESATAAALTEDTWIPLVGWGESIVLDIETDYIDDSMTNPRVLRMELRGPDSGENHALLERWSRGQPIHMRSPVFSLDFVDNRELDELQAEDPVTMRGLDPLRESPIEADAQGRVDLPAPPPPRGTVDPVVARRSVAAGPLNMAIDLVTLSAGTMNLRQKPSDLDTPSISLIDGVLAYFEQNRFHAGQVDIWLSPVAAGGQGYPDRIDILPGPKGPEPGRINIDTRHTILEKVPFRGLIRPRRILVTRDDSHIDKVNDMANHITGLQWSGLVSEDFVTTSSAAFGPYVTYTVELEDLGWTFAQLDRQESQELRLAPQIGPLGQMFRLAADENMPGFTSKTPLRSWLLGLAFINDTYAEIPSHPVTIWAKKMTVILKSSVIDGRLQGAIPVSAVIEGDREVGTPAVLEDYDPERSVIMKAPRIEVTFRPDGTFKRIRAKGEKTIPRVRGMGENPKIPRPNEQGILNRELPTARMRSIFAPKAKPKWKKEKKVPSWWSEYDNPIWWTSSASASWWTDEVPSAWIVTRSTTGSFITGSSTHSFASASATTSWISESTTAAWISESATAAWITESATGAWIGASTTRPWMMDDTSDEWITPTTTGVWLIQWVNDRPTDEEDTQTLSTTASALITESATGSAMVTESTTTSSATGPSEAHTPAP